jgi:16S rRNA (guanine966-N2)-methyltransferase
MRIVAGDLRGRRLDAPPGRETRPTTDRVRESLFNLLAHAPWARTATGALSLEQAIVLDAFAGSGALGFEALSRGARKCWFWDRSAASVACIRENAERLGITDRIIAQRLDATTPPAAPQPADLIFLDPPYEQGFVPRVLTALSAKGWLEPHTLVVVETKRREVLAPDETWQVLEQRGIGDTGLTFLRPA